MALFNSEGNQVLAEYAYVGLRLYFLGYLLAGVNIMLVTYFSATDRGGAASVASILRGVVAVVICAILMAWLWGMNGIWLSFLAAEGLTLVVIVAMLLHMKRRHRRSE